MKLGLSTDHHHHIYGEAKSNLPPTELMSIRLDALMTMDSIMAYHNCEAHLFAGDLVHSISGISKRVSYAVENTIGALQVPVMAISGNHDFETKNLITKPGHSYLQNVESKYSKFRLIDQRPPQICGDVLIVGVPYFEYKEHFEQALNAKTEQMYELSETGIYSKPLSEMYKILLIHQTPGGTSLDSVIDYDTHPTDPVYSHYDFVFCGHIHGRAELSPKFLVGGSPWQTDASEAGQVKGFYILDTDTRKVTFIPLNDVPKYKQSDDPSMRDYDIILNNVSEVITDNKSEASEGKFHTALSEKDLVTNYFKQKATDPTDSVLLSIGLKALHSDKPIIEI